MLVNSEYSRVLYVSGTAKDRKMAKVMGIVILVSGGAVAYSGIPRLGLRPPVIITAAFFFSIAIILAWVVAFCKNLIILDDAMVLPAFTMGLRPRTRIPFSKISEIRLNTGSAAFKTDVELILIRGKAIKIPKMFFTNWDEFYKTLIEDLKGKVRVVP